jgi:hypothetical protein
VLYGIFFNVNLDLHPFLAIAIKSTLAGVLYLGISYFLGMSVEVNRVIDRYFKKNK